MTEFTPGPWEIERIMDFVMVVKHGERSICRMSNLYSKDAVNANAALIASAPDLYAALEAAIERLEMWRSYQGDEHYELPSGQAILTGKAALRKARGEVNDD